MSITIDDMKMPKSCIACPFEHNGDCYGGKPKRIMDIEDFNAFRHPDCPLIEAEPKHGRWIEDSEGWWHCSVCGRGIPPKLRQDLNEFNKWCSRCGAKMDEVEE